MVISLYVSDASLLIQCLSCLCGHELRRCFANVISTVHKYRPEAVILLRDYNLEIPLENYLQAITRFVCNPRCYPGEDTKFNPID